MPLVARLQKPRARHAERPRDTPLQRAAGARASEHAAATPWGGFLAAQRAQTTRQLLPAAGQERDTSSASQPFAQEATRRASGFISAGGTQRNAPDNFCVPLSLGAAAWRRRVAAMGLRGASAAAAPLLAAALLALACGVGALNADGRARELSAGRALLGHSDHSYKPQETVALYANKAGPFHNPRRVAAAVVRDTLAPGAELRFSGTRAAEAHSNRQRVSVLAQHHCARASRTAARALRPPLSHRCPNCLCSHTNTTLTWLPAARATCAARRTSTMTCARTRAAQTLRPPGVDRTSVRTRVLACCAPDTRAAPLVQPFLPAGGRRREEAGGPGRGACGGARFVLFARGAPTLTHWRLLLTHAGSGAGGRPADEHAVRAAFSRGQGTRALVRQDAEC